MRDHCSYDGARLVLFKSESTAGAAREDKSQCPECGRIYQELPGSSGADNSLMIEWVIPESGDASSR